jgi:hypothetical protein
MARWTVEDSLATELVGVEQVVVQLVGGEVTITAIDGPARLEISQVKGGAVEVTLEDGRLTVAHVGTYQRGLGWLLGRGSGPSARVTIGVPGSTRANVSTVTADILVAGLARAVNAKSVSGDVTLKGLSDAVQVRTVSGDVAATDVSGDLTVASVSGDVGMVNGSCHWLQARTVSGDVTLDLALPHGAVYSINTVSGGIGLRVPTDPSVVFEATSLSGRLSGEWDLRWDDLAPGRRRVRRTIGSGDARLQIKTLSGDVRVARRAEAAA